MKFFWGVLFLIYSAPHLLFAATKGTDFRWEVFISTKHGFSIEYPAFAVVTERKSDPKSHGGLVEISFPYNRVFELTVNDIEEGGLGLGYLLILTVHLNEQNLHPNEYWRESLEEYPEPGPHRCIGRYTPIKINNANGYHCVYNDKFEEVKGRISKWTTEIFNFQKPPYLIRFNFAWPDIKTYPSERRVLLKKQVKIDKHILKSFRFIK